MYCITRINYVSLHESCIIAENCLWRRIVRLISAAQCPLSEYSRLSNCSYIAGKYFFFYIICLCTETIFWMWGSAVDARDMSDFLARNCSEKNIFISLAEIFNLMALYCNVDLLSFENSICTVHIVILEIIYSVFSWHINGIAIVRRRLVDHLLIILYDL